MIIDNLRRVLDQNKNKNALYVRNLLKEQLQYYVLNFIYNSPYAERFLFKGGTCLRFCFDLPRLSEDLDFDVGDFKNFDFDAFTEELEMYFKAKLKYDDISIKISGRNKIIYLQFPILGQINFPIGGDKPNENTLFLRIDLASIAGSGFKSEISLRSTYDFSFIIKRYSLPDLYAGKIAAVLMREKWEGDKREPRFKGRDYFDLFWLNAKGIKPNLLYLKTIVDIDSKEKITRALEKKLKEALKRKQELKQDVTPFFLDQQFVNNFIENLPVLSNNFTL